MHSVLKSAEVQQWIQEHLNQNVYDLALKKSPFEGVSMQDLVQQLQGKKIAKKKFPYLFEHDMLYPPKLNLEQTSSQVTAEYKANLVKGKKLIDLTGGFGIDAIFFAQQFKKVTHVELNASLQHLAAENFETLGLNIESHHANGVEYLKNSPTEFDVIYVDPSRRNASLNKVFLLEDLTPNLFEILPLLLEKSKEVLVKLSPLIDVHYLVKTIPEIFEIHLVSVKNEMKEVLLRISSEIKNSVQISCTNLESKQEIFGYNFHEMEAIEIQYSDIKKYIYEPNAAIQKSGGNDVLGKKFGLKKLHPNTQLYTCDKIHYKFPGRVFEVGNEIKNPKRELKNKSIMAIHRNFPENLKLLQKKFRFSADGIQPILFTKTIDCIRITHLDIRKTNMKKVL